MSYDIIVEDVPSFIRRVGDRVIEGSNNSIIVLGTDRVSDVDSGYVEKQAGSIHAVVGRKSEGFDYQGDKAFIYLSMKSDPDKDLGIENSGDNAVGKSTVVVKADDIRVVARNSVKIVVGKSYFKLKSDGTVTVEGSTINLGANAAERLVKESFLPVYFKHTHAGVTTGQGMSGPPTPGSPTQYTTKKTKSE